MASQQQPRPWFRMATMARPPSITPAAPPPAPNPAPQLRPAPTFIQPFRPLIPPPPSQPTPPPAEPTPPPPPPAAPASSLPPTPSVTAPSSPQPPNRPVAPASPFPRPAANGAATAAVSAADQPRSPIRVAPPVVAAVLRSPAPASTPALSKPNSPVASPAPPPPATTTTTTTTVPVSASYVPTSPAIRNSAQSPPPAPKSSPVIYQNARLSPKPSPASPAPAAPPPPSSPVIKSASPATTSLITPTPKSSPKIVKPVDKITPPISPVHNHVTYPPSPLQLPPAQINADSDSEPKIPQEAEQKRVLFQELAPNHKQSSPVKYKQNHDDRTKKPETDHYQKLEGRTSLNHKETNDLGMRVVTLAGENRGAIMELSPSRKNPGINNGNSLKKQGSPRTWGKAEKSSSSSSSSSDEERSSEMKERIGRKEVGMKSPPMTAFMNSNVQAINNSILHNSSCTHHDPGVHLSLSRTANGHRQIRSTNLS